MAEPRFDSDRRIAQTPRAADGRAQSTSRARVGAGDRVEGASARKVIRTDHVRYPGVEDRLEADTEYEQWKASGRRLRPARDTGIHIERRVVRDRRRSTQVRRNRAIAVSVVAVVALLGVLGWRTASDRIAATQPFAPRRTTAPAPGVEVARAAAPVADPTPMFASHRSLQLRLPVRVQDLTEVGFHQASYSYALKLKTTLPDADMGDAKADKSTNRDVSKQQSGPAATLVGSVLRMWRDRPGKPETAVDIGADPGSDVLSPVTGTVVLVKKYDLYNKYPDVQIHIQPDGFPKLDVVLIHLYDPSVTAGQRVDAGITRMGRVRKLSDKMNLQLRSYTDNGGNHVHLQVNDATHPDYEGLDGAIKVKPRPR